MVNIRLSTQYMLVGVIGILWVYRSLYYTTTDVAVPRENSIPPDFDDNIDKDDSSSAITTKCADNKTVSQRYPRNGVQENSRGSGDTEVSGDDEPAVQTETAGGHGASSPEAKAQCTDEHIFFRADVQKAKHDAISGGPMEYLSNYRNPCWISRYETGPTQAVNDTPLVPLTPDNYTWGVTCKLRCLPLVYLLGFSKSGTSDLYATIKYHPQVKATKKEPLYWSWGRFGRNCTFEKYLSHFDRVAGKIRNDEITTNASRFHSSVILDASSNYVYHMERWREIPGHGSLSEPRCTIALTLQRLVPRARLIILMRNPVHRAHSRYKMYKYAASPEGFHGDVVRFLREMKECLKYQTIRGCAYNYTHFSTTLDKPSNLDLNTSYLRASLYHVYVADWLAAFPRDQILFLKAEEYYADRTSTVKRIFEFLELSPGLVDYEAMRKQLHDRPAKNTAAFHGRNQSMLNETSRLLGEFFEPHNRRLAELLSDERYLWKDE